MYDSPLHRFLGGSPLAVLLRLAFVSLVVGALMAWLDIDALVLLSWIEQTVARLWAAGFDAVRQLGRYFLAGAALVVPIWLVTRLFGAGQARPRPGGPWRLPGAPPDAAGRPTER